MKKNGNKSLKSLKTLVLSYESQKEYKKALNCCKEIIKYYPNSTFGYENYIKISTNSYTKLVYEKQLKDIKNAYDKLYEITSKSKIEKLKSDFNEYLLDCKEVYNLKKIKKEIIEELFNKEIYDNKLSELNRNIKYINSYSTRGEKVTNIYDLIRGVVFFACLIFNLIYRNYLLFITIPFGIFGIIIILNYIISKKPKKDIKQVGNRKKELICELNNDIENIENNLKKINTKIEFLYNQKQEKLRSIPMVFQDNIKDDILNNESKMSSNMFSLLEKNKYDEFIKVTNRYTSLNPEDYIDNDVPLSKMDISKLINYKDDKSNLNKILNMKKLNILDFVLTIIFSFISIFSLFYIINNVNLNYISFIISIIIGVISMISYNVDKGKHASLFDTFSDNLIITIFRAVLVYDLIYSKIHHGITIKYGFIKMPMIFLCLFIGFVLIISLLKYLYLYKKLIYRK